MAKRFVKSKLYNTWNGKTAAQKEAYQDSVIFVEDRKVIIEGNADGDGFVEFDGRTPVAGDGIVISELALAQGPYVGLWEIEHADTSSLASISASGRKYITGVTLDGFGHVTGLTTGTETVVNTNTTYDLSTAANTSKGQINLTAGGSGSGTDSVYIEGGTDINVKSTTSGITVAHDTYADPTFTTNATATELTDGSEFTAITGLTIENGHVTGGNKTKYKLDGDLLNKPNFSGLGVNNGSTSAAISPTSSEDHLVFGFNASDDITITGVRDEDLHMSTITFSHDDLSGVTVGSYGPSAGDTALGNGEKFKVPYVTVNKKGHVTGISNKEFTLNTPDTKLTKVDFTAGTATTPTTNTVAVVSSIPDATGTNGQTVSSTYTTVNVPTKKYVDDMMVSALEFKGELTGSASSPGGFTPAATKGNVYVVTTAGYVNGVLCEVGDTFMAKDTVAAATSSNYSTIQNSWVVTNTNWNVDNKAATIGTSLTTIATIGGKNITAKIPSSLKNPNSLKVVGGSTDVIAYDGSATKTINVVGAGTTTVTGEDGIITISSADQYKGTVTSVGMTVPTGLSVAPSAITSSGTFAITYASGYSIPTTAKQTNWDTAYGWGNHASAGYVKSSGVTTITPGIGLLNGTGDNNITSTGTLNLAPAKTNELGGIKVASVSSSASNANTAANANKFAVHLDSNGLAYVAIPAYSNNSGDITGVTAGVGLTGGGTSGSVTVKANLVSETRGSVAAGSKLYYNAVSVDSNSKLVVDTSSDWEWEVLS